MRRCKACGRRLTDPESKALGYGPECYESIFGKQEKTKRSADMSPADERPVCDGQISMFDYLEDLEGNTEYEDM